jgi:hypothetical protein
MSSSTPVSASGSRSLGRVLALAALSIAGLIGMLLARPPILDAALIGLAAAPLIYGLWRWHAGRR